MRVTEGSVEIKVPEQPDEGVGDEVFFNPVQELNRDLTAAVLRAFRDRTADDRGDDDDSDGGIGGDGNDSGGDDGNGSGGGDGNGSGGGDGNDSGGDDGNDSGGDDGNGDDNDAGDAGRTPTYLDATAASGVRGVRAAANGWAVTCCDVDPEAVALCRENLERNELEGEAVRRDASALMHERTFDAVDVDPFGTPVPFADAAVRSAGGLLCVTATDTAPLCGAHFESGVRHYGAVPRNTEFHAEMGLRVLVSALVRTAARHDRAATPLLSHATDHYARTYLALESGARAADAALASLGYVDHCQHCLYRESTPGLIADPLDSCPECGHGTWTAGPIWLAPTRDADFAERVRERVSDDMGTAEEARDLCRTLAAELDQPTHYDQHRLCKRWGVGAVAMGEFLERLRAAGFAASRTHYGGTTFKTDADVTEIRAAALDDE